jgi:hypothetical protein
MMLPVGSISGTSVTVSVVINSSSFTTSGVSLSFEQEANNRVKSTVAKKYKFFI